MQWYPAGGHAIFIFADIPTIARPCRQQKMPPPDAFRLARPPTNHLITTMAATAWRGARLRAAGLIIID